MHVIRVDGRNAGLFVSRKMPAEADPAGAPQIVFERDAQGRLDLIGYILPAEGRSTAFRLKGRGSAWVDEARTGTLPAAGSALTVALASSPR